MTNATASFPFPVLGPGRLDYVAECSYQTSGWTVKGGDTVSLRHRIEGDCLVSRLVAEGKAQFACIVVLKATMYRRTFPHNDGRGALFAEQTFTIERGRRTIETPQMLPIIALTSGGESINAAQAGGLDPLWQGQNITLPEGAILAMDRWHEFIPGIGKLLKVVDDKDNNLHPHEQMRVDIANSDGGYFLVRVTTDLFKGIMRAPAQGAEMRRHRNSILTHALSIGFAKYANVAAEDADVAGLENFQSVKRCLQTLDVPTWDDGEEFDPCRAACAIHPHTMGTVQPAENGDE